MEEKKILIYNDDTVEKIVLTSKEDEEIDLDVDKYLEKEFNKGEG